MSEKYEWMFYLFDEREKSVLKDIQIGGKSLLLAINCLLFDAR